MPIIRLSSSEINRTAWDECVSQSFNGIIYGYSWYLDAVCDDWEGLVDEDYGMVMPLPVWELGKFRFIKNTPFLPYVSIYSRVAPSTEKINQFISAIPYKNVSLCMLPYNGFSEYSHSSERGYPMVFFDLIMGYEAVDERFHSIFDLSKYRGANDEFSIVRTQGLSEYIAFRALSKFKIKGDEVYLKRLLSHALRFKNAGIYVAFDNKNMPVAMMAVLKSNQRLSVVDAVSLGGASGRKALFFILRQVVRVHAESNLVLNFPSHPFELSPQASPLLTRGVQYKRGLMRLM